jgi:ElaB/YqjD/DUF883 family membrane-anchored ribosome-binding protein
MENEEIIRQHMERTRESLTDKLETLENKIVDSVDKATSAVSDTVTSVKETMHEGVETVKDAVDVPAHVDRHPWLMLGGSVLCGYILGNLLPSGKKGTTYTQAQPQRPITLSRPAGNGNGRDQTEKPPSASFAQSLLGALEPELQHLKGLALGVSLGTVREMLTEQVPPHMADQLRNIIDGITRKIGGEPVPSSDFASVKCSAPEASKEFEHEKPRW